MTKQTQTDPVRGEEKKDARWQFDHHRLDAWWVAKEAMIRGFALTKKMPRGYGKLKDQLERALEGGFLQTSEAAARTGADRLARFRSARAEAGEAAAALEGLRDLKALDEEEVDEVLGLLWRLCGMLTRLARIRR